MAGIQEEQTNHRGTEDTEKETERKTIIQRKVVSPIHRPGFALILFCFFSVGLLSVSSLVRSRFQNCRRKRRSLAQNCRMSSMAYFSMVMRCGPMPKAKPLNLSGS